MWGHSISALLISAVAACGGSKKNSMTDVELKLFIEAHLDVGDSKNKIEAFLNEQKWPFDFNRFESRYEARYEAGSVDKWYVKSGVSPRIYVDQAGRFSRDEIFRAATGPVF